LIITGCGEVDESDGDVVARYNSNGVLIGGNINLPTDSALTLYCPDAGIAGEPCILDDPQNPFSDTPIFDTNKFVLYRDLTSAKASFYLWGTAQAMSPRGENQYYTGVSLQQMFTQTGSALAREQALRAYRSVLDNYFDEVTFFQFPDPPAAGDVFYPKKVRLLAVHNLWEPATGINPLFANNLLAWEALGEWGYTYEENTGDVFRNF
jgi:hypothetical protein